MAEPDRATVIRSRLCERLPAFKPLMTQTFAPVGYVMPRVSSLLAAAGVADAGFRARMRTGLAN
jgi:hypothetical protein